MPETTYRNPVALQFAAIDPAVSVVIPTYNRQSSLMTVLDSFANQGTVDRCDYEIVLGDDGSTDGTFHRAREWASQADVRLVLVAGAENRGPAHARNQAMKRASGKILLITGDDILPPSDFLTKHLAWHREHPDERDALLGPVGWPDAPAPTPFMRWLERQGRAFYFVYPDTVGPVPPDRFYTCNVSVKRALALRCGGFREDFPYASHEDLEFGMRLATLGGMHLFYHPGIEAIHHHRLTPEGTVRRVYLNGCSSVLYWKIVPDTAGTMKRMGRWLCRSIAHFLPFHLLQRVARRIPQAGWYSMLVLAYWRGVDDAAHGTVME